MIFSPGFVFAGLCLALSRSYMLAGGRVAVQGILLFGKWFLFVFGGSVMIDASRYCRGLVRNSSIFSFLLFTWTAGWLAPQVISFVDFLFYFSSNP
jgi:hypothetical protein